MPRNVPITLLPLIQQESTSLCTLIRVDPVQPGYPSYGAALLDVPVTYNDGISELVYQAIIGAQPSTLVSAGDLSVDGGAAENLLPEFDFPISEADLIAGAYDFARFRAYLVDYRNLDAGHVVIGTGTLGRIRVNDDGLSFTEELRGLAQNLRQTITEKWSLSCRATFGSQPIGTPGAEVTERYPCKFDVDELWEAAEVAGVGDEPHQVFLTTAISPPFGGTPGMVRFTSGANAGRSYEVEEYDADTSTIHLTFPAMFAVQPGDEFDFRDDCPKTPEACKERENWEHYRGEPNIPVSDAGQIAVPGASAGIGLGATVNTLLRRDE